MKKVKNGLFSRLVEDDRQGNETEDPGALEEWQDKDRYPTGDGNKRPEHQARARSKKKTSDKSVHGVD